MSIPAYHWAREQGRRLKLSVSERALLNALADRCNDETGLCCPGQDTLAEDTGLTERSIRALTPALVALGLIRVERRGRALHYHLVRANGLDGEPEHRKPLPVSTPIPEATSAIIPEATSAIRHQTPEAASAFSLDTGNPRQEYRNPVPPNLKTLTKKESKGSPSGSARARKPLPADWHPNGKAFALADRLGIDPEDVTSEADKMRDWATHRAEIGADWDARFNNWLRKEAADRQRFRKPAKRTLAEEWNLPSFLHPDSDGITPVYPHGRLLS